MTVKLTDVITLETYDAPEGADVVTCGTCGRSWDDGRVTAVTPAPSGRCPFEYEHAEDDADDDDECDGGELPRGQYDPTADDGTTFYGEGLTWPSYGD